MRLASLYGGPGNGSGEFLLSAWMKLSSASDIFVWRCVESGGDGGDGGAWRAAAVAAMVVFFCL